MESLTSDRLLCRPLTTEHADDLFKIYQEPEVSQHLLSRPRNRAEFEPIFQNALSSSSTLGMWALFVGEHETLAGRVGFFEFSDSARPEVAFLLARNYWGHGYATEACRAALAWAFPRHSWLECIALVRPDNRSALSVCSKIGMKREARIELRGTNADLLRVARDEFERCAV